MAFLELWVANMLHHIQLISKPLCGLCVSVSASVCIYSYLILPWNEILHGEKSTDSLRKNLRNGWVIVRLDPAALRWKPFYICTFCHPSNSSRVQNTLNSPLTFWTFCFWKVTQLHCSYFFWEKRWPRRNLFIFGANRSEFENAARC